MFSSTFIEQVSQITLYMNLHGEYCAQYELPLLILSDSSASAFNGL